MNGSGQPGRFQKFSTVTVSSNYIMLCVTCCWKVHVVKTCDWGAENAEFNLIFLLQLFFFLLPAFLWNHFKFTVVSFPTHITLSECGKPKLKMKLHAVHPSFSISWTIRYKRQSSNMEEKQEATGKFLTWNKLFLRTRRLTSWWYW